MAAERGREDDSAKGGGGGGGGPAAAAAAADTQHSGVLPRVERQRVDEPPLVQFPHTRPIEFQRFGGAEDGGGDDCGGGVRAREVLLR
jgi:hypothetical protein